MNEHPSPVVPLCAKPGCGLERDAIWPAENGLEHSWARHDCGYTRHEDVGCHPFVRAVPVDSEQTPDRPEVCRICGDARQVQGFNRDGTPHGKPIPCPECNEGEFTARYADLMARVKARLPADSEPRNLFTDDEVREQAIHRAGEEAARLVLEALSGPLILTEEADSEPRLPSANTHEVVELGQMPLTAAALRLPDEQVDARRRVESWLVDDGGGPQQRAAHEALDALIEAVRRAADEELAVAAEQYQEVGALWEAAEARAEAAEQALREIVKLAEDDAANTYPLGSPEMGRKIGWQDAALIARAALSTALSEAVSGNETADGQISESGRS